MNALIEALNAWADPALRFAWPMLWQSSLLIALLFALDLLMRGKVRPAVRYALWLVVLAKLLLPPSLAFPTSAGWWLRPAKALPARPHPTSVVVTYGVRDSPALPVTATPVFVAPPLPTLTPAAWTLVGMMTVSLGLLAWMTARWHQATWNARRAAAAPAWLSELLPELQRPAQLKLRHPELRQPIEQSAFPSPALKGTLSPFDGEREGVKGLHSQACASGFVRLTDHPQSPAVCGLFRPVILLPRSLAEHLPPAQLRAVLLHELFHLRRGDVWVNCAQALLQIVYWWHPLLWLANARIRRVREEAVDDAVMLALNKDAETYAPTLLEVAKLALHRPLASLGLVGILESRSSLRQRIERLMDFHPPRRAGLGLAALLGVLGFAALAVPMGEAPAPTASTGLAESQAVTNAPAPESSSSAGLRLDPKAKASRLVRDGKLLYEMDKLDEAEAKLKLALQTDAHNEAALYYLNLVSEAKFVRAGGRRWAQPGPNPYARTNLVQTSPGRQAIVTKLNRIRLDRVSFDGLRLSEVMRFLAEEAQKRDPDKLGVNFIIRSPEGMQAPPEASLDPLAGLNKPARPAAPSDPSAIAITIKPPLTNVRLGDVLDAIVKVAAQPIKYSIETYAVVFSAKTAQESPPLYVRNFKIDQNTLIEGLHVAKGPLETNVVGAIVPALLDSFAKAGAALDPVKNPGKSLFYSDRSGMLMVRATLQDLDIIENVIQMLNVVPPQINIKAKLVEIPQDDTQALGFDWYLGNMLMTNGPAGGQIGTAPSPTSPPPAANPLGVFPVNPSARTNDQPLTSGLRSSPTATGILTERQYRVVLKALQQREGAELVAQPEVTVISGRQAQCKAVDVRTIVKGIDERALTPPGITSTNDAGSSAYETEAMEFGPSLDITSRVLPDGYTINLSLVASLFEFLGYEDNRTNLVTVYLNGKQKQVSPPRPIVRIAQITSQVNVWDGQTLVLGGLVSERPMTMKDSVPLLGDLPLVGRLFRNESRNTQKRKLLVFITPTIIDPAGNRLHSEEEMPSARQAIPPQPTR